MTAVRSGFRIGLICGVVLALLIGAGGIQAVQHYRRVAEARVHGAGDVAERMRLRIEGAMQRRTALRRSLVAFATAAPRPDAAAFAAFAEPLIHGGVAALVMMPGGRIEGMLGGTSDQLALGRKLALDPIEWTLIGQAVSERRTIVSDPFRIDGRNLIAVYDPIYLRNAETGLFQYWGVGAIVYDFDDLQAEIEGAAAGKMPQHAIYSLYHDGTVRGMVAGERSLAGRGEAMRVARFPGGMWEVAVAAPPPVADIWPVVLAVAPAMAAGIGLTSLLLVRRRRPDDAAADDAPREPAPDMPLPAFADDETRERRGLELEDQRILLRSTLESLDEGVAVFDDQGLLILWNSRFPVLVGIDPICLEQGIGLGALIAIQGQGSVLRDEDVVLTTPRGHYGRTRASLGRRTGQSGSMVRVELCWAPGDRTVVILSDETGAARAAQVLAASEQRLRRVLEVSPLAIVVFDRDGRALFYNDRHRELLGLSHLDMRSYVGASSFVDPADMEGVLRALRDHGVIAAREVRLRRPDGTLIWVSLTAQNVTFDGQKATICQVFDITALKQASVAAGSALSEFAAGLDHEVGAPAQRLQERLSAVLALARAGASDPAADLERAIDHCLEDVDRLNRAIRTMSG